MRMDKKRSITALTSAFLHTSPFHLAFNTMSWWHIAPFVSEWDMFRTFILGCVVGSAMILHQNQTGLGASAGIYATVAYLALTEQLIVFWQPIMFISWLGIWVALVVDCVLNLSLDYVAERLRAEYPSHQILSNINLVRYGINNVSFWGHFGGAMAGVVVALWHNFTPLVDTFNALIK